ncbi:uroporphyrinogen-III synthase [bacterium]|nr:uroporphyrinogen-III synthase [bacterium]
MKQTLKNIKVLIPRPIEQTEEFSEKLTALGATPIVFPLIKVKPINQDELVTTFSGDTFDWIIFTSKIAVQFFFKIINPTKVKCKIACVGTSTQKAIEDLGLKVNFVPSAATAKKLVKEIPLNKGEKVFIPRSKIAGTMVKDTLEKRGILITELSTYSNSEIEYSKEDVENIFKENINVISFTSASTVNNFASLLRKHKIKLTSQHLVSIGPSTTAAAKKMYLEITKTAETHNIEGTITAIESLYV